MVQMVQSWISHSVCTVLDLSDHHTPLTFQGSSKQRYGSIWYLSTPISKHMDVPDYQNASAATGLTFLSTHRHTGLKNPLYSTIWTWSDSVLVWILYFHVFLHWMFWFSTLDTSMIIQGLKMPLYGCWIIWFSPGIGQHINHSRFLHVGWHWLSMNHLRF